MTNTAPFTRRILSVYRAATPEDHSEGMGWYDEARSFAESLDTDVSRAAGVIAAVSPMLSWPRNQTVARAIYAGKREGLCLPNSVKAAARIMDGEHPLDVLNGPKVRAFYMAIMGEGDSVTLDRHAIDIAVGRPLSDTERAVYMGARNRRVILAAYVNAAHRAGVSPAAMQAITWVAWRKTRAQAYHVNG